MTFFGWVLKKIDLHAQTSFYPPYSAFYASYAGSATQTRAARHQTILWILGAIASQAIPEYWENFPISSTAILIIFGVTAILVLLIAGPSWHSIKYGPFTYRYDWFPITTQHEYLREAHDDKLRLSDRKPVRIVVYFDILGKIDGYDFKLVTSDNSLEFEIGPELGMSQEQYPDGTGVYCEREIEDDSVFNIFEVEKKKPFGGDPSHRLQIIEVSNIASIEHGDELTDKEAQEMGTIILEIEVTE